MTAPALAVLHLERDRSAAGGATRAVVQRAGGVPVVVTLAAARPEHDAAARLAAAAAGGVLVVDDLPQSRRLLESAGIPRDACDRLLAGAADLRLFGWLIHPEANPAVAGEPARDGADALLRRLAELLGDLAGEAGDAVQELRQDLEDAGSPLARLLDGLTPAPAALPAPADPLLGPPRGEAVAEPAPVTDQELLEAFGAGGPLARAIPGYVVREAQVALARVVATALNGARTAVVEAGTGVGKSYGYLVPVVLFAVANQWPVVVATRTKNLQAQLFDRDLPRVRAALDVPLRAALVKGRGDYLCLRRLQQLGDVVAEEGDPDERLAVAWFRRFARRSQDGDLERVPGSVLERLPAVRRQLEELRCEHGARGRGCPYGRRCPYPRAARRAALAHVLVANHALVLSWPRAFPPADVVVFDEAHDLVDSATDAFGWNARDVDVRRTLGRVAGRGRGSGLRALERRLERRTGFLPDGVRAGIEDVVADAGRLQTALDDVAWHVDRVTRRHGAAADGGRRVLVLAEPVRRDRAFHELTRAARRWNDDHRRLGEHLLALAETVARDAEGEPTADELRLELAAAAERVTETALAIEGVLAGDPARVAWLEYGFGAGIARPSWAFRAAPIDVGAWIAERVLAPRRTAVLTSATLRVGGSFDFFATHLGFDLLDPERRIEPLALGSPFDYADALRFYVPLGGGDPLAADVEVASRAVARAALFAALALGGRTLVLFNARARMLCVAELLRAPLERHGVEVFCPGPDGSAARVLERFRLASHGVLLGARAFWEGIDVPGARIACTVMERVPFESPADPVHAARTGRLDAAGGNGFRGYSLPRALVRLLQGAGRIVRGEHDRGAVVLLDPRVATNRSYGPLVRATLPSGCEIGPAGRVFARLLERFGPAVRPECRDAARLLATVDAALSADPTGEWPIEPGSAGR